MLNKNTIFWVLVLFIPVSIAGYFLFIREDIIQVLLQEVISSNAEFISNRNLDDTGVLPPDWRYD